MPTRATCLACSNDYDYDAFKNCPKDGTPLTPIAAAKPSLVGEVLDERYKILHLLGEGRSGSVYKAEQLQFGRPVAVKILHSHLVNSEEAMKRFQREAQATSKLRHPNLLTLIDFGFTRGQQPYMVTEFLDGATIETLLVPGRPLHTDRVISVFNQICDGLMMAHEQQVIHRDIKPSNIVLVKSTTGEVVPKVIDFGLVKFLNNIDQTQQLTVDGQLTGNPGYMSPEQCMGQTLDARTDIYSLGCVLYLALTGRPPFSGDNMGEVIVKQLKEAPPPFSAAAPQSNISPEIEKVVFKAIAKSPEQRHQSMREFRTALENSFASAKQVREIVAEAEQPVAQPVPVSAEALLAQPQVDERAMPKKQQQVMFDAEKASRQLVAKDHHQRVDEKSSEVFDKMRRRQSEDLSARILRSMKSSFVGDETRAWLKNVNENLSLDVQPSDRQLCQLSLAILIDRLFDDFQRYACLFNQTEENLGFVVSCVRPKVVPDASGGSTYEGHLQNATWAMKVVGDSRAIEFLFIPAQEIYQTAASTRHVFLRLTVDAFDQQPSWSFDGKPLYLSQVSLLSKKVFARLMRVSRGEVSEKEVLDLEMTPEPQRTSTADADSDGSQDPADVITYALISILESVDEALANLRLEGAAAMQRGGIDAVAPVMLKTKQYDTFREKTAELAKEWAGMLVN